MTLGIRGPIPERSDQRVRTNEGPIPTDQVKATGHVPRPQLGIVDPHPIVKEFWDSLYASAQRKYMEPSDWTFAKLTMHALQQELYATDKNGNRRPIGAVKLQVICSMLSALMVTEGDRRRLRIEVTRGDNDPEHTAEVIPLSKQIENRLNAM